MNTLKCAVKVNDVRMDNLVNENATIKKKQIGEIHVHITSINAKKTKKLKAELNAAQQRKCENTNTLGATAVLLGNITKKLTGQLGQ